MRDPCLHGGRCSLPSRPHVADLPGNPGGGSSSDESLVGEEGLDVLDALGGVGVDVVIGIYWLPTLDNAMCERFAGREVACTCQSRNLSAPSVVPLFSCSARPKARQVVLFDQRARRPLDPDGKPATIKHMRQSGPHQQREWDSNPRTTLARRHPLSRRTHSAALAPLHRLLAQPEPPTGLEPATSSLQERRSTN